MPSIDRLRNVNEPYTASVCARSLANIKYDKFAVYCDPNKRPNNKVLASQEHSV